VNSHHIFDPRKKARWHESESERKKKEHETRHPISRARKINLGTHVTWIVRVHDIKISPSKILVSRSDERKKKAQTRSLTVWIYTRPNRRVLHRANAIESQLRGEIRNTHRVIGIHYVREWVDAGFHRCELVKRRGSLVWW
jgi:hypothetical protein